eukprot:scaffold42399_cov27-Phaeocystis_antarctica.AAC.2
MRAWSDNRVTPGARTWRAVLVSSDSDTRTNLNTRSFKVLRPMERPLSSNLPALGQRAVLVSFERLGCVENTNQVTNQGTSLSSKYDRGRVAQNLPAQRVGRRQLRWA